MVRTAVVLLTVAVAAACGSTPAPSVTPPATAQPSSSVRAEKASGPYLLTLDLARGTWQAGEPIIGEARLSLTQGDEADLGGSGGGVVTFNYAEIGGAQRSMVGVFTADCATHRLFAATPFSTALQVSGSYSEQDPNADFYRAFISAPFVALPAGTWDISAVATFAEGAGCSGAQFNFATTVRVTVTP